MNTSFTHKQNEKDAISNSSKIRLVRNLIAFIFLAVFVLQQSPVRGQIITRYAGGTGATADGIPATSGNLNDPEGIRTDNFGNLFIADEFTYRVREVDLLSWNFLQYAGILGVWGHIDAFRTAATFSGSSFLIRDAAGNIYISDAFTHYIRRIDWVTGMVTSVAGNGLAGHAGDGGQATAARLNYPSGLAIDAAGNNLYIGDRLNHCIRRVNFGTGIITTIAGNPTVCGYGGDGGAAATSTLCHPEGLMFDATGNLFICDAANHRVRYIDPAGIIRTYVGNGVGTFAGDGGPATAASLDWPNDLAIDANGDLFIADEGASRVRKVDHTTTTITTFAGNGGGGSTGDGGPATSAQIGGVDFLTFDCGGNLLVCDEWGSTIRKIHIDLQPTFVAATSSFSVCAGASAVSINSYLSINDADVGQGEYWTVITNPTLGTLGGFMGVGVSTGGTVTPTGLTYTPPATGSGTDVFTIRIMDCGGAFSTKSVTVNINPSPTISGVNTLCVSSTTTLIGTPIGGTWTSSSTGTATVGSSSGVVTGVAAGVVTITYTLSTGCYATHSMTINPIPSVIAGPSSLCVGSVMTLTVTPTGGVWTSSATSIATVGSSTGIVTGVFAGTATITYTLSTGCRRVKPITVNPNPAAISGAGSVCVGFTLTLTDATAGGTWTSSSTSVATVGSSTGIVTGVSTGTATITYTLPTGCYTTATVTVVLTPAAITGPTDVCVGRTITLSDATGGGVWTSSSTLIATVGSSTGIVTGVALGTATITYSIGTGCYAIYSITVNPNPASITGPVVVCVGRTITLSDATPGGTWTSSSTGIATVGSSTGVVTGVSAGTAIITYTLSTGCFAVRAVTVRPNPAAIGGPTDVCVGATITLTDATSGGIWTSSSTSVATIGSSTGIVTGVAAGTATITYTAGGCFVTYAITVNPNPAAITGLTSLCVGDIITLSDATSGGTWTSSSTGIATVGSSTGDVTGVSAGIVTITYSLSTGCYATYSVTVNPNPAAITGATSVCVGSTITLADATSGGTWTSSATGVATVGSSTGIVSGVAVGTATITYTLGTGCYATYTITVVTTPAPITGPSSVCVGATITLTSTTGGGIWSTTSTDVIVGSSSGDVTGVSVGIAVITYTSGIGCSVTATITVNPNPAAITGLTEVCVGATITLSDATGGGAWTSSATGVATVGSSTGIVTGIAVGTATITYALGTGCYATYDITVNPNPAAITGPTSVCVGFTITLADATGGGTWTSSATGVATIGSSTGIVTGVSAGTATITYTIATGCYAVYAITVNPNPAAIAGPISVCVGLTITLTDATGGGTWTSSSTGTALVGSSTGIVTGVTAGTVTITYTLGTGCYATYDITVNPNPAAITGATSVCVGSTITLSDATSGGTWTSSSTGTATVGSSSGIVTGVSAGTATITYTLGTGCYATYTITVVTTPAPITGPSSVCVGATITLTSATGGGTWTSSATGVATIGSSTGIVTGISVGTATITYTSGVGCDITTTITVNPNPAAITGLTEVCVGATITLSDATSGGTWTSSSTGTATVGSSSGIVTGVTAGTATITYTLGTGCYATYAITVNPNPAAITGPTSVCVGFTITLADATSGGTWTSSATGVATIGSSTGIVTGVSAGTATITYMISTGCYAVYAITVNPNPAAIAGPTEVCVGLTITLTDATSGGTWTSSSIGTATVGSSTGIVTGVAAGTATITYTLGTGCYATYDITVNPNPAAITGPTSVCVGSTITLADATSGGTWTSSSTGVATVGSSTGIVTGVSAGTATITYTIGTGCYAVYAITVNPNPAAITGPTSVCVSYTITLMDATSGGTWASSATGIATVGSSTGIVTGVSMGTATITYTLSTGCYATYDITVNPLPAVITGTLTVCVGSTTTLSDATSGGTWTSSATGTATVGSSTGIVTGIAAGTATITYTLGTGCYVTTVVTVNPLPATITGTFSVCVGSTTTLSDATGGGIWTSSTISVATIGSSTGIVTGVAAGTTTITYTLSTGCYVTATFTVNPNPAAITGTLVVCMGATTTLSDATSGGSWSSATISVATVGSSTGVVTGVFSGTSVISYTLPTGCYAITTVTVPTAPAITGTTNVCVGSTITLSNSAPGGVWSSGAWSIATIGSSTGIVTGIGAGVAPITYIVTVSGCTMAATYSVTVNPLPVMHPSADQILCGTITLSADITGGSAAYVYSWSPGTGLSGVSGVTVTCSGLTTPGVYVYTITCTDPATGCSSTATTSVIVMCDPAFCSMCANLGLTPLGGDIGYDGGNTYLTVGRYYVYADLTIHGVVEFKDAVVMVAPNKKINVLPNAVLNVRGSHFFACGTTNMWTGIELQGTTTHSAKCHMQGNSLIEDAVTAVYIPDGIMPDGTGTMVFSSDSVIFNRNITGVQIVRFPATGSTLPAIGTVYPFFFRNTVFTSRDIPSVYPNYPCDWPWPDVTSSSLKLTGSWTPSTPLLPPYNADNPVACFGSPYNTITCKNGADANIGIDLQYVGGYVFTTTVGVLPPANFSHIVVGENIFEQKGVNTNLFDYLHKGINSLNSNLTSYNNAYIHMYPTCTATPCPAGNGIYSTTIPTSMAQHAICRLQVLGGSTLVAPPSATNVFYDCKHGVQSINDYQVHGWYAKMFSDHGAAGATGWTGSFGYNISSSKYHRIIIRHNELTNIWNTGIFVSSGIGTGTSIEGITQVSNNTISCNYLGVFPGTGQFVNNAIVVRNTLGVTGGPGGVVVNGNVINWVYNGITVQNFNQPSIIDTNNIWVQRNTAAVIQQYGINSGKCLNNRIRYNNVYGLDPDLPPVVWSTYGTGSTSTLSPDNAMVAVYSTNSQNTLVNCNLASRINTGFQFYGQLLPTRWFHNTMHRNRYGFVLRGAIGPQGSPTTPFPSDNIWVGPTGWYPSTAPHYQTFTLTSITLPTASPLHVRNITTLPMIYNPSYTYSYSNPFAIPRIYGTPGTPTSGNGLNPSTVYSAVPTPDCEENWNGPMAMPIFHSTATQTTGYTNAVTKNYWMAQRELWNNIANDLSLADSSAILDTFWALTANSRYEWLYNIEQALVNEDYSTAATLLGAGIHTYIDTAVDTLTGVVIADDTLADTIVQRYIDFYSLYHKYKTDTLTPADTCKVAYLANLCPIRDGGAVVYEARGLYSLINGDPGEFNDNCEEDSTITDTCTWCGAKRVNNLRNPITAREAMRQLYRLYPNPNAGSFTLVQQQADEEPVVAEIVDVTGRVVYKERAMFTDKRLQIMLNGITSGIYVLHITDNQGRRFNFKFVVTK